MATYTCEKCGATVDVRCKPQKCQMCGGSACLVKTSPPAPEKKKKNQT